MRRVLLTLPIVVSLLVVAQPAKGASPASGSLDRDHLEVTWTGSTAAQLGGVSPGYGCLATPAGDPTCDYFELRVGELDGVDEEGVALPNDVLVAIATPAAEPAPVEGLPGAVNEYDLFIYDDDGNEIARNTNLGSEDEIVLRDAEPGDYTVAVQAVLLTDPTATYEGAAAVLEDTDTPLDTETACGAEGAEGLRDADRDLGLGLTPLLGDPTAAADGVDRGERISLDVLVYLDDVAPTDAQQLFADARASYEPLNIDLHPVEIRTHTFRNRSGEPATDGLAIIREAKRLLGGTRPDGIDIVEVLVGRDIKQLGQSAVAGIADCIGGVAHDDRAFLVAEAYALPRIDAGPLVIYRHANADVTAHEIGHLLGGQHHYANCVEGVEASDYREEQAEATPCTLMFNAADFLGPNFGVLNGAIARGSVWRYARP